MCPYPLEYQNVARIFDWTARLAVCYDGGVNNFWDFSNEKNCAIDNFVV